MEVHAPQSTPVCMHTCTHAPQIHTCEDGPFVSKMDFDQCYLNSMLTLPYHTDVLYIVSACFAISLLTSHSILWRLLTCTQFIRLICMAFYLSQWQKIPHHILLPGNMEVSGASGIDKDINAV